MGLHSHLDDAQLAALRDKLHASLVDRLTSATSIGMQGRNVAYQQRTDDIRREISAIGDELALRQGRATRGPIHVF